MGHGRRLTRCTHTKPGFANKRMAHNAVPGVSRSQAESGNVPAQTATVQNSSCEVTSLPSNPFVSEGA